MSDNQDVFEQLDKAERLTKATERTLLMVAALYVQRGGCYWDLPGVDPWDEARDARRYAGPHPVVAHPPCSRWCRLAGLVEARWGHKRGEDGGCFSAALEAVRRYGGVLEHPAWSAAFAAHGLNSPPRSGGWIRAGIDDAGWVCHVEQCRYGHRAKKATWLYACTSKLPSLRWGSTADASMLETIGNDTDTGLAARGRAVRCVVSWCGNRTAIDPDRPRLTGREASATPPDFRDVLLSIARSVHGTQRAITE